MTEESPLTPLELSGVNNGREKINRNLFRELMDDLPIAAYVTDAEGRLTYFNAAAVEFSGRTPKLGTDLWCVTWKLYYPDGTPMAHDKCPMAVAMKENRPVLGEEAIAERPDGKRIWFRPYPCPLRNHEGQVVGGANLLIDITDEKEVEKQFRQNERDLNDFFENATVGLHWVGADGTIKRVNRAELDLLGYTRDEYVGRPITDFHADREVIDDILKRLKAGEELHDYEAQLRCKDGSIRYVKISSNVYILDEKFIHTRCLTRDITEQKKAEQSLLVNEERLACKVADMKRLYELSTQLLEQNNVEAALQEVIKASAELMNADKASVQIFNQQENVLRLVDAIGFDGDFSERFAIIESHGITTCAAAFKDQKQVLVEDFSKDSAFPDFGRIATSYGMNAVLSTPLIGSKGQFFGVFSMYWCHPHRPSGDKLQLLDLYTQQATRQLERQQAEEALQTMNKTLEARVEERTAALLSYQEQLRSLTSELSKSEEAERQRLASDLHDNLGQILAIGKMKVDLMLRHPLPEQARSEAVEMADLMNNAITYTRDLMSDLKPPPSLEKESLAVNLAWVANKMKKHHLKVVLENDGQPMALTEDMRRTVCQCVKELLFNVIKHAGIKEARVILSRSGKYVQVIVEDEGRGYELKGDRPAPTKDGGFGLFNIYERMDWLGGRMDIATIPGKGTKITLLIPLLDLDVEESSAVVMEKEDSGLISSELTTSSDRDTRVRVLLVDDHKIVRSGLRKLIEEEEDLIVIAEATNGREAVELALENEPDVTVMDINMPEMDGIEATRVITVDHQLNTRIIGLSLHDKENVKEAMKSAGATAYLTKTEAFESLSALIRSEAMTAREIAK